MTSATMPNNKAAVINYDFNKKLYICSKKTFSEIGSLFQNFWLFYDRTSVTLFFHAFYYVLGVVFQKVVAASHPFFSCEIIHYERRKDKAPGQGQETPWRQTFDVKRKPLSLQPFVASFKPISLNSDFIHIF